jgi:hypothetical protein
LKNYKKNAFFLHNRAKMRIFALEKDKKHINQQQELNDKS